MGTILLIILILLLIGALPIGANFVIFAATSETESASETVVSLAALVVVGRHVTTA